MKRLGIGLLVLWVALAAPKPDRVRFAILGDRTGETVPGIYEQVWKDILADKPDFVVGVGDSIQGGNDATAEAEWRALPKYPSIPLYQSPGNHDIWSEASARLYEKYTGHPPHYSFDEGPAHFAILDNSRADQFAPAEIAWLEQDLKAHEEQPVKFIVSHRPSWLVNVLFNSPDFEIQRLAKKYGVRYVIAGHLHKLAHAELEGVTYLAVPSSGGHLRDTAKYEDGYFFGYAMVEADAKGAAIRIKNLDGRVTELNAWGKSGLLEAIPQKP